MVHAFNLCNLQNSWLITMKAMFERKIWFKEKTWRYDIWYIYRLYMFVNVTQWFITSVVNRFRFFRISEKKPSRISDRISEPIALFGFCNASLRMMAKIKKTKNLKRLCPIWSNDISIKRTLWDTFESVVKKRIIEKIWILYFNFFYLYSLF